MQLFLVGWLVLAGWHGTGAVADRARDWAYFRLSSGADVLPNISFENRAVIRYLRERTPENSRIVICSDQKLFFLSYYLLPRRLYHRMHPDAEFVIPRANQELPLKAYRAEELDASELAALRPDFILEYFEAPEYVERDRLNQDAAWVASWRAQNGGRGLPDYLVVLRPYSPEPLP